MIHWQSICCVLFVNKLKVETRCQIYCYVSQIELSERFSETNSSTPIKRLPAERTPLGSFWGQIKRIVWVKSFGQKLLSFLPLVSIVMDTAKVYNYVISCFNLIPFNCSFLGQSVRGTCQGGWEHSERLINHILQVVITLASLLVQSLF